MEKVEATSFSIFDYRTEDERRIAREREQIVAQSNKLIARTQSQMKLRELRILLYLISKVKPADAPDTEYRLSVADIAKLTPRRDGTKSRDPKYSEIKKIVNSMNRMFWIEEMEPGKDFGLVWFSQAVYIKRKGIINFTFSEKILPYLFALKEHYTSYPLSLVLPMRSQYSVRLYELLKAWKGAKPNYEYIAFPLDTLKKQLGADSESYKRWDNFKRKVLEPALGSLNSHPGYGEINLFSDINVSYRVEKLGRSVDKVIFHVMKKAPQELEDLQRQNDYYLAGEILRPEKAISHMAPMAEQAAGQLTIEDFMDAKDLLTIEDGE